MKRIHRLYVTIVIVTICSFLSSTALGELTSFSPNLKFDVSRYTYEELLKTKETLSEWMKLTQIEIREREKQQSNEKSKEKADVFPAEIVFCHIPWGSNISDSILQFSGFETPRRSEIYIASELKNAAEILLYPRDKTDVAGYDLSYIQMTFLYTVVNGTIIKDKDNVRLIRAMYYLNALNKNEAYEDLKVKLSTLYGEGIEESVTAGVATTWSADDGSYVQLENGYFAVQINYDIKGEIYDSWHSEILEEQKRQESENIEGNFNGL